MNHPMFKILKQQNPDTPSNVGKLWTDDEENTLLEELNNNIDIVKIADNHNRAPGGINSRRKTIAYKLHIKGIDIEEIIEKTKLDKLQITEFIAQKENYVKKKIIQTPQINTQSSEISELKNEIIQLKKDVKEMLRLIHELYDFETQ